MTRDTVSLEGRISAEVSCDVKSGDTHFPFRVFLVVILARRKLQGYSMADLSTTRAGRVIEIAREREYTNP